MIIEDDPLVARMYQRVFQFEKFEVSMARNGEEGIRKLKKFKPNLILLDIMMPKLSGIDVLKDIKSNPKLKSTPVIVLTNLSGMEDAEKALSLGAVKFIVKSKNKPKKVVKIVRKILKGYTRDEVPE